MYYNTLNVYYFFNIDILVNYNFILKLGGKMECLYESCINNAKINSLYCEDHDKIICQFDLGWVGRCKQHRDDNSIYCKDHIHAKCECCGKPAIRVCGETSQGQCCEALICETCVHELDETGCNVTSESHIKQGDPQYPSWIVQCLHRDSIKFDPEDTICIHLECDEGESDGRCKHYTKNACQHIRDFLDSMTELKKDTDEYLSD